jgi:hypothetical protein
MRGVAGEGTMIQIIRRMGIALGSLVAATLCVGLLSSLAPPFAASLPVLAFPFALLVPGPSAGGSALSAVIAIVLGGLIYRDILIRERTAHPVRPAGHRSLPARR